MQVYVILLMFIQMNEFNRLQIISAIKLVCVVVVYTSNIDVG